MPKQFKHPDYNSEALTKSIYKILKSTPLWSMATVNPDSTSHINTAYFCFDDDFNFYFLTPTDSVHSRNIETNSSIAAAIFDTSQPWGVNPIKGLQVWGHASNTKTLTSGIAKETYGKRFKNAARWLKSVKKDEEDKINSRFYKVTLSKLKLVDEKVFGEETFIEIDLNR